jgi:hypothetical protein
MRWRRATDRTYRTDRTNRTDGSRKPVATGQSQTADGKRLIVLLPSISKEILEKLAAFFFADARGDQAAMV